MIVFLVSGLWHGADLSYVIWGGINGFYQVAGEILAPVRNKAVSMFGLHRESLGHRLLHMTATFLLVDFSWIFFRADGINALRIIKHMITVKNPWILLDGSLYQCGLDSKNFWLMLLCMGILLFADCCKYKGIQIRNVIVKQDDWFRWIFIAFAVWSILTFGIWGTQYNEANFIYFQF